MEKILNNVESVINAGQKEKYQMKEDLRFALAELLIPHLPMNAVLLPTKKGITMALDSPEEIMTEWEKMNVASLSGGELKTQLLEFASLEFEEAPKYLISIDPIVHTSNKAWGEENFRNKKKEKKELGVWKEPKRLREEEPRAKRDRGYDVGKR